MLGQCLHAQLTLGKDGWHCAACLRIFLPSGETGAEQEAVKLRSQVAQLRDELTASNLNLERLAKATREYIAYEVKGTESSYCKWNGQQWIWNSEIWRKANPQQFAHVHAIVDIIGIPTKNPFDLFTPHGGGDL